MGFNSSAVAARLVQVLEGIGVPARIGAPQALTQRVSAWVGLGGMDVQLVATCVTQRTTRFYVLFCYRIDNEGAVAETETALMVAVDGFLEALYGDLSLDGLVDQVAVSAAMADEPNYQVRAGREFREYPVVVMCDEQGAYEVNV